MKKSLLIALLLGNIILLTTTLHWMGQFRKLKEIILDEYSYAKGAAEKEYVVRPEHGLKFFDGREERQSLTIFPVGTGHGGHCGNTLWNTSYCEDWFGYAGTVDANDFSYDLKEKGGGGEMPVSQKILVLLMKQLAEQGKFVGADYNRIYENHAFGYLSHPAGFIVIIVTTGRGSDQYNVFCAGQFRDRPSRGGAILETSAIGFGIFSPGNYFRSLKH